MVILSQVKQSLLCIVKLLDILLANGIQFIQIVLEVLHIEPLSIRMSIEFCEFHH